MNSNAQVKECQLIDTSKQSAGKQDERNREHDYSDKTGTVFRSSGSIFIIRECVKAVPKQFVGSVRACIDGFSNGAAARMRRYLRECLTEYCIMVTLTYPGFFETDGKIVKNHLRRFLQELRREYIRQHSDDGKHSSFWFLEFQFRGAPHFHIFTTWTPGKEWVSKTWYRIVDSEDERHLHAGTRVEVLQQGRAGTISYASKYALKAEQKDVPENYKNVGRFWGVFGRRSVVSAATFITDRERRASDAKKSVELIFRALNTHIHDGNAEVIIRKSGVCVLTLHTYEIQRNMRALVSRLSARISRFDNMFIDAELDTGEGETL